MDPKNGLLPPDHVFVVATKQVKSNEDMSKWEKSEAYQEYMGFISAIGRAICGKKIRDVDLNKISPTVKRLVELLDTLSAWVEEFPPEVLEQRFGNKSYRKWHAKLVRDSQILLEKLVDSEFHSSIIEIRVYLNDCFGNPTRIDYGTGHEMAFVMFLACLFKIGALKMSQDEAHVGLVVFDKYLTLVRKLQTVYRMEPAGSQGVWALDDYQFIPFIWGSAQLVMDDRIEPRLIPDYEKAELLAPDYHFFSCINYIAGTKTGPFAEHSNQLWNVSAVPSWSKVQAGLTKMYKAEVLSKFPVIQHTFFGSIFTLKTATRSMGPPGMGMMRPPGSMMPPPLLTTTIAPKPQ